MLPNYQFKLWHVFYLMALLAVSFSYSYGLLVAAAAWFAFCFNSSRMNLGELLVFGFFLGLCGSCFAGLFLMPEFGGRQVSYGLRCSNNIRQLQLAMLNYDVVHKHLPKASLLDDDGKPIHSWRVLILPFIEEQALYDQYDFDEPWDGPNNRKLIDRMPAIFGCPGMKLKNRTCYKLVVGPVSAFDEKTPGLSRIVDGTSNTIALVEDFSNPVEWTRPSDVTIEEAIEIIKWTPRKVTPHTIDSKFQTKYVPGNVGFFDGSLECRCFDHDKDLLRKLFGINDGIMERSGPGFGGPYPVEDKVEPFFALGIFILLMLIPLRWAFALNKAKTEIDQLADELTEQ